MTKEFISDACVVDRRSCATAWTCSSPGITGAKLHSHGSCHCAFPFKATVAVRRSPRASACDVATTPRSTLMSTHLKYSSGPNDKGIPQLCSLK